MLNLFKNNNDYIIEGKCLQCGKCCKNLILVYENNPIKNLDDFEKLKEKNSFYSYFDPSYKCETDGFYYFTCSKLLKNNTCSIHKIRPEICVDYPTLNMLKYGGKLLEGCGYKIKPKTPFSKVLEDNLK